MTTLIYLLFFFSENIHAEKIYSDDVKVCRYNSKGELICKKPVRPDTPKPEEQIAELVKQEKEKQGDKSFGELAGGSVDQCTDGINAINQNTGDKVTLYRCQIFNPQKEVVSDNPLDGSFYLNDTHTDLFPKSLVSFDGGKYFINLKVQKTNLSGVPDVFNCNRHNNLTENQCLVCNCFHESRNTHYEEMFSVNRVVHSRVIDDKIFPKEVIKDLGNDVCNIVYDGIGGKNPPWAQFSWTVEKIPGTETPKQMMQIGYGSNLNATDKAAYSKCVSSVKKSLDYKDEYFASFYFKKNMRIPAQGWKRNCFERSKGMYIEKGPFTGVDFIHRFYPVCEGHELEYVEQAKIKAKEAGRLD